MNLQQAGSSRALVVLALPILGVNLLHTGALAIDTALCGRLPESTKALGALAFSSQIIGILAFIMLGLTVGTVALIARARGAGDESQVIEVLHQSAATAVVVGVVIAAAVLLALQPILTALGADGEVRELACAYLGPMIAARPISFLVVVLSGAMRGVGNTKIAFRSVLIAQLVNVPLTYCLVLGKCGLPAMGITGAALGSVAAEVVNALLLVIAIKRRAARPLRLSFAAIRLKWQVIQTLFRIGIPAAAELGVNAISYLLLVGMLARIDSVAVGAHGVSWQVQWLALMPALALSQATAAMVGVNIGAQNLPRARAVVRSSCGLSVAVLAILGVVIAAGAAPIASIFGIDAHSPIGEYTRLSLRVLALAILISGIHISLTGAFQGLGMTGLTLRITLMSNAVQLGAAAILSFSFALGAVGVWLSVPVAMLCKIALDIAAYRRRGVLRDLSPDPA